MSESLSHTKRSTQGSKSPKHVIHNRETCVPGTTQSLLPDFFPDFMRNDPLRVVVGGGFEINFSADYVDRLHILKEVGVISRCKVYSKAFYIY